jgi:SAM-dependent methyltransferase
MSTIQPDFNPSITQPHYLIRNRLLRAIRELAPRLSGKMMDFGCGQKPYRSLFTVSEYIGVDYENPGHPHVNESIDVYYDGKTLPFEDNSFDAIFTSEVFEHIFNLPEIIRELHRVLRPGGQILLTCPFAFCEHEQPNDFARYSSFAIRHLVESAGFEVEVQQKTGNSIEALTQLQLMYLHQHIYTRLKKIPVVRSLFRLTVYTAANLGCLLAGKILPEGKDLYLNNVLLCRKKTVPVP